MTPDPALLDPALVVESPLPGVLLLRLNRPERRNALSTPLLCDIADALVEAEGDSAVRAVVITGGETIFAAGADINELAASGAGEPVHSARFVAWQRIRAFPKPLIAAVEGWCLGAGLELMMCCDLVVAAEGARFGAPETNLGIIPGAGGTSILPRLVGQALAMRMVLTGEPIGAGQALDAGLIAEVAPTGQANAGALALAEKLAGRSPHALREAKTSVRQALILSAPDHVLAERIRFVALLDRPDKIEGVAAFKEKRMPEWTKT